MIVKVQLPVAGSHPCVLIQDEKRTLVLQVPLSRPLLARMACTAHHPSAVSGAELRKLLPNEEQLFAPHYAMTKFFHASPVGKGEKSLELDAEVAAQAW